MTNRGRKTLYSEELHTQIVNALSTGVSIADVCASVGISHETYHQWCRTKPDFLHDTQRARVAGRISAAAVIRKAAASGDVQAAQWYLERTDPMNWGRKDMVISLGLDPATLRQLKQRADAAGVDLSTVFEAMVNELGQVENAREDNRQE